MTQTETPAEAGRHYRCKHCGGVVAINLGRRTLTLTAVRKVHDETCPGLLRK